MAACLGADSVEPRNILPELRLLASLRWAPEVQSEAGLGGRLLEDEEPARVWPVYLGAARHVDVDVDARVELKAEEHDVSPEQAHEDGVYGVGSLVFDALPSPVLVLVPERWNRVDQRARVAPQQVALDKQHKHLIPG